MAGGCPTPVMGSFTRWRSKIWVNDNQISELFNSVLKGSRSLPVTALVQLTFFHLNGYFVARRELGANRLASDERFTPYVDA